MSAQAELHFDGHTYSPEYDGRRLGRLLGLVFGLMADGQWRTLQEICAFVGGSEASVSARLRDLRKPAFGGHRVERRPRGSRYHGLYEYRLEVSR